MRAHPNEGTGPDHVLRVATVGEPYDDLSTGEFEEFELIHPEGCIVAECAIAHQDSLRWSLTYSGTPITEPGEYIVHSWWRKHPGDYGGDYGAEWDGGIALSPR